MQIVRIIALLFFITHLSMSASLDLTNIPDEKTVKLIGPWNLYKDTLLLPSLAEKIQTDEQLSLPGYVSIAHKGIYSGYGAHTLQIKLHGLQKDSCYALHVPEVFSAFKLYWNDTLIAQNGLVGPDKERTKPEWKPVLTQVKATDTTALLTYHIANFHYKWSGFMLTPHIGTIKAVQKRHKTHLAIDLILFGAIGIFAIYHFLLYFLYKKDKTPLYFGIITFFFAIRTLITGELLLTHFWKEVPWELLVKLNFIGIGIFIPFFGRYLHCIFPNQYLEKAMIPADILSIIYCLIVAITPAAFHSHLLSPGYHLVLLYGCVVMVISMVRALRAKAEFAHYPFWAMVLLTAAIINDVLVSQNIISTIQVTPIALVAFVFLQAFLISKKFSMAFHAAERYAHKLQILNSELEDRVAQRTLDLSTRNKELEEALAEVKTLSGLLPICAHCKKIKDDNGYWEKLEEYFEEHADIDFSHGLCPDCAHELYPGIDISQYQE